MRRTHRDLVVLVWIGAAIGCGSVRGSLDVPAMSGTTISRGAWAAFQSRWPGAVLGDQRQNTCSQSPDGTGALLSADLNGDRTTDTVAWMTTGETTRLAAAFARTGGEFTVVEVGSPQELGDGYLVLARQGTPFQKASASVEFYFGLDTVLVRHCNGRRTAWLWNGETFRATPMDD